MKLTKQYIKELIKEELAVEAMPQRESLPITIHGEAQDGAQYSLTITKFEVYEGQMQDDEYLQTAVQMLEKALAGKMTIG